MIKPTKYPYNPDEMAELFGEAVNQGRNGKQDTLVSGTNIKTINGASVLGSGDLTVSSAAAWGGITGTLSSQTDLNTALNAKQDTLVSATNTKTINGSSILGSGNLNVSAGLTVGTTAITSGTIGGILFQGTGNVLQQSANLFWDNTNNRLGIGTSTPGRAITVTTNNVPTIEIISTGTTASTDFSVLRLQTTAKTWNIGTGGTTTGLNAVFYIDSPTSTATPFKILSDGTTNLLNTTINNLTSVTNFIIDNSNTSGYSVLNIKNSGASGKTYQIAVGGNTASSGFANNLYFADSVSGTRMTIYSSGNLGINTTTDAGFKLNVNGTARVQSGLTISGQTANNYLTIGTGTGNAFFVWSAYFLGVNGVKFRAEGLIGDPSASATSTRASAAIDSRGYLVTDSIGIGTTTSAINASAIAQIDSTTKGFLPPRMTNAQMLAIAAPAAGLVVYDTTNNKHCGYNGTAWQNFY